MGGKHLKTEENTHNLLPETMSSMKRFFEWGLQELKKDIMHMKAKNKTED
jgi:hypothetical protein